MSFVSKYNIAQGSSRALFTWIGVGELIRGVSNYNY